MGKIKNRFSEHLAIKERRDNTNYSRRDIAEVLDVSRSTVDSYMNNQTLRYDIRIIAKICAWLNINVTEFFVWDESASDSEDDDSKEVNALLPVSA